jgi:predicted nuclease of predicted toxin-antitoxin system
LRFLIDMGIGLDVSHALRAAGHDCVHLTEQGLERLPDTQIIAKAAAERRIVLTHDLDFGRLLALSGLAGPSIITFRLSDMRPSNVLNRLLNTLDAFGADLEKGAALVITDRGIRRRTLPIQLPSV